MSSAFYPLVALGAFTLTDYTHVSYFVASVIRVFCIGKGTVSVCKTMNGKHDKDIIVARSTITECERLGR